MDEETRVLETYLPWKDKAVIATELNMGHLILPLGHLLRSGELRRGLSVGQRDVRE